jgi:hypothetical protein
VTNVNFLFAIIVGVAASARERGGPQAPANRGLPMILTAAVGAWMACALVMLLRTDTDKLNAGKS